ncbi:MAG: arginine deiminase [Bacilli bacterium]|nr:arginine deiminase [Bacilli bacterium]
MINIKSEIKPLKKVLLHRPGKELLNLTPDTLERLLFDDIPYLKVAQEEHDQFARILKDNGVEVVYLEDLMTEVLDLDPEIKETFIKQYIYEAGVRTPKFRGLVYDFLMDIKSSRQLVLKTMEGINIKEITVEKAKKGKSLIDMIESDSEFIVDPMPNLYFTRDDFASIGNGISLNKMYSVTRNRETIYAEYIFNHHPDFKDTPKYFDRYNEYNIEGGDILNLNDKVLAIGISQRTSANAIETLARNIFKDPDATIETVLAFRIPESRAFMHLDTVFTQIDVDKFTYHPGIVSTLKVYEITKGDEDEDDINVKARSGMLNKILEEHLGREITLIPCAGGDPVAAEREQWNDGSNTLCIAPGVVIVYDRNNVTNDVLRRFGITVLEMRSAELSRGRGGPRCMSMPLIRED